jgi:hypothetical protein
MGEKERGGYGHKLTSILTHTHTHTCLVETLPNVMSTWRVNNFLVYERPHVRAFLRYVCVHEHVSIYTFLYMSK